MEAQQALNLLVGDRYLYWLPIARGSADHRHGLYAYKRMSELQRVQPPIQSRIVFFTGGPAQAAMNSGKLPWVKEALR